MQEGSTFQEMSICSDSQDSGLASWSAASFPCKSTYYTLFVVQNTSFNTENLPFLWVAASHHKSEGHVKLPSFFLTHHIPQSLDNAQHQTLHILREIDHKERSQWCSCPIRFISLKRNHVATSKLWPLSMIFQGSWSILQNLLKAFKAAYFKKTYLFAEYQWRFMIS